ncbi:flagellar biosynthesis protein FlhF [Pseudalkalibacillus decolorationis]|uniref:flagellar biosynthesis protein FlhF n=1 Tax=Pseudalkalibacillus decolorationis TaxID=163879 RepID=UPI002147D22C|nr:flagellar biosynthesis protein FlhF [Pseudalkalibacillus decolorationis]
MKIKKYIALTMPEAMKRIREDFGNDGVILNSKEIRTGGFFGFFTKPALEVIAAHDPDPYTQMETIKPNKKRPTAPVEDNSHVIETAVVNDRIQNREKTVKGETDHQGPLPGLPHPIEGINKWLITQGFQSELRRKLIDQMLRKWYQAESDVEAKRSTEKWLEDCLLQLLSDYRFGEFNYEKKYLNLIGPTGVGKTTTIAKIAADTVLNKKKKAAMITTDTYRIAAIDQLKTYAELLNIPIEVAYNSDDFKRAKQKFADFDIIFVDSAGRNFKDCQYVQALKEIIHFDTEMENYLVLSLTSKLPDMLQVINQFTEVPIHKLVFTKKDETDTFGDLFNVIDNTGLDVAYITTGQNVPDDIIEANPTYIVSLLLEDRNKDV